MIHIQVCIACFADGKRVPCAVMDLLQTYDLAVAWTWEYDRDFILLIHEIAGRNNVTVLEISSENVESNFELMKKGGLHFCCLLDRASDEDESFQPLGRYVLKQFRSGAMHTPYPINPLDLQVLAADKATMHLEFIAAGIDVPYTIIISPYSHKSEVELSLTELAKLGRPFIIKPANTTGGGIGVVKGAETLKEIIDARQAHKNDKYLLQETIRPMELAGRRAWFRVFYAFSEIIPCWWDDLTHTYSLVTKNEEQELYLEKLRTITRRVQTVCKLEFFSTEIVYTVDGKFVAVDYVNEMCDMRLQSKFVDGVPDAVVSLIVTRMIEYAKSQSCHNQVMKN